MAYKFQLGAATLSGSLTQEGAGEFDTSLTIGSAVLSEADLEKLDDITDGAAAANKALVLDSSRNISNINRVTAAELGAFQAIGAIDFNNQAMTDVDINSGAIDGTVIGANSQAAAQFTTMSGSSTLQVGGTSTFAANLLPLADDAVDLGASGQEFKDLYIDGIAYIDRLQADRLSAPLNADMQAITNINVDSGAIDGTVIGANSAAAGTFAAIVGTTINGTNISGSGYVAADQAQFRDLAAEGLSVDNDADVGGALSAVGAISGSAALSIGGTVRFDGVADAAAVDADSIYFFDATDNLMKKESVTDLRDLYFGDVSGDATIANGGALTIAAGAVELAMMAANSVDSDQYVDGSIDTAHIADAQITLAKMADNSVDSDQYVDGSIDTAHIADAQITLAKMADNSVDSDQYVDGSVDNIHLANSAITLTQGAGMAAMGSVSLGSSVTVAVDGVLEDLDTLGAASADGEFIVATGAGAFAYESGNTARTSLGLGTGNSPQFTGLTLTGDLVVQGSTTTIDSTTINISSSFLFEGPADDHETELNCAVPVADTTLNLPTLSAGTYYIPALADAATDASAAVTAAEFALLDGGSTVSRVTVADADGFLFNHGGTMKQVDVRDVAKYVGDNLAESIDSISSDETLSDFSGGKILLVNSSGGDVTVTLPASANHAGEIVKVKKISTANNVILEGNASETLDGSLNITLESPRAALSLISDGSNWFVM